MIEKDEEDEISSENFRFDIIDCEVVSVSRRNSKFNKRDGLECLEEVASITNTPKEEGQGLILRRMVPQQWIQHRVGLVMSHIVVFGDYLHLGLVVWQASGVF
jgi:hypothetical protein